MFVKHAFFWMKVELSKQATLALSGATVGSLLDTEQGWPVRRNLKIDGLTYIGFGASPGYASGDANTRLRWLVLQTPGYHPQPYSQLAKFLRQSGDDTGARRRRFRWLPSGKRKAITSRPPTVRYSESMYFSEPPTEGTCTVGWHIESGRSGNASLDGPNVAAFFYTPDPMHEGNWSAALYLDSRASADFQGSVDFVAAGRAAAHRPTGRGAVLADLCLLYATSWPRGQGQAPGDSHHGPSRWDASALKSRWSRSETLRCPGRRPGRCIA